MRLSIIAAVARNGVIGKDGDLPWRLPADLRRFKRLTLGHHLIVGRRTWESIGRPLPGRKMVVLSRREGYAPEGVHAARDLSEALEIAATAGDDEAFVAGGAAVYELALPKADRLYLTHVEAEVEGDTLFPRIDLEDWLLVEDIVHPADRDHPHPLRFCVYDRKRDPGEDPGGKMTDSRYPIGDFTPPEKPLSEAERRQAIETIAETPARLREALEGLNDEQLDTPYRRGGWTVRQVVHHLPDSHLNSYVRFRLTLTEDVPTIGTYREDRWAELPDARTAPIGLSLDLLDAVHRRWVLLLRSLDEKDWSRELDHPEIGRLRLDALLALYSWHGPHHVAHVTALRERQGW